MDQTLPLWEAEHGDQKNLGLKRVGQLTSPDQNTKKKGFRESTKAALLSGTKTINLKNARVEG